MAKQAVVQVHTLSNIKITAFQEDLIQWFYREKRDLPWREDPDPYRVWVSEIMLQQTRVDTVIPYYHRFLEAFPSPKALAEAEEEKVLKAWEGLGYYSRARNLQAAVKEVVEKYDGKVPNTKEEIAKLKGVGPYTAGAVLSIAYNKPEPAVDGNVMRVLSRILSIWDDIAQPKTRHIFEGAVRELISHEDPSAFNQALMELGALICTPTSPSCLLCPVQEHCHAFKEGVQRELPVKSKKKPPAPKEMAAAVIWNKEGKVLVHKRPETGLLANLWEFPNHETLPSLTLQKDQLAEFIAKEYGLEAEVGEFAMSIKHVFSHLIWNISVYTAVTQATEANLDSLRFVSTDEILELPFPVSHQKILKECVLNK